MTSNNVPSACNRKKPDKLAAEQLKYGSYLINYAACAKSMHYMHTARPVQYTCTAL